MLFAHSVSQYRRRPGGLAMRLTILGESMLVFESGCQVAFCARVLRPCRTMMPCSIRKPGSELLSDHRVSVAPSITVSIDMTKVSMIKDWIVARSVF
jgi:hypothetical protein